MLMLSDHVSGTSFLSRGAKMHLRRGGLTA